MGSQTREPAPFRDQLLTIFPLLLEDIQNRKQLEGKTPVEKGIVETAAGILRLLPDSLLMEKFTQRTHTNWTKLKNRDTAYIRDNTKDLFHGLPEKFVVGFQSLLLDVNSKTGKPYVDINRYWTALQPLVPISIQFIHQKRGPRLNAAKPGGVEYQRPFMPEVQLGRAAKEWDVKLVF